MDNPSEITYIGRTDFRNANIKFGIKAIDRTKHMYIIGKTGMGKSTFLENLIIQDIQNGNGLAFIDPHGDSATKLLDYIPKDRIKDVIYINPSDTKFPVAFNPLEDVDPDRRPLVVDGLMTVFKKIWPEAFSGRMEYILSNAMASLLEYPNPTLLSINRFLTNKDFRKRVIAHVTDPTVKDAWEEFARWDDKKWSEAISALTNKVGQFTTNPVIRNIVGQPKSSFDFRKAMDERKIMIIDLSKGKIGEQNQPLFGAMLITKIYLAAMSRADLPVHVKAKAPPFYFYVDEFQNFANDSFANILSEARKYKLCLTVANQYVSQMAETVRDAVFGNMGTTISFRVGPLDSELMEKVFAPVFTANDIINLEFGQYYLTLQIDGMGSRPFSARTIWPLPDNGGQSFADEVIAHSQKMYGKPREEVERDIMVWYDQAQPKKSDPKSETKKTYVVSAEDMSALGNPPAHAVKKIPAKKGEAVEVREEIANLAGTVPEVQVNLSSEMSGLLDQLDQFDLSLKNEPIFDSIPEPVAEIKPAEKVTKTVPVVPVQTKATPTPQSVVEQKKVTVKPTAIKLDKTVKERAAKSETKNALLEALEKAKAMKPVPKPIEKARTDGKTLADTLHAVKSSRPIIAKESTTLYVAKSEDSATVPMTPKKVFVEDVSVEKTPEVPTEPAPVEEIPLQSNDPTPKTVREVPEEILKKILE